MIERLGVERSERRLFLWSLAGLFWIGWADVSLKNVAETLFLKRVGVDHLPLVFLVNSILLVGSTWVLGQIVARTREHMRLVPILVATLGLLLLPLYALVGSGVPSVFGLLVVASKQVSALAVLVFFVALGDLLDARQAKRLFAPLAGGVTLGIIAGSFASEPIARLFGISSLLPVAIVALLLSAAATMRISPSEAATPDPLAPPAVPDGAGGVRPAELWRESALFRLLCVTALCSGVLAPMLYFEFSYVVDSATQGVEAEQQLLSLYARFRGWIHVAVLIVQFGLAARIYRWIGTPLAIAFSPLIYLLGFTGLSLTLSLPLGIATMSAAKLQDNAIYDPALRTLLDLLPEQQRARAMALLEGPVKRLGGAAGSLLVIAALSLGGALWVGRFALPIALLWIVVAVVLWRAYPSLLLATAEGATGPREKQSRVETIDGATLRKLARHLFDPEPERCRSAIELVSLGRVQAAVSAFAEAALVAPPATRPMLIKALDRVSEGSASAATVDAAASAHIAELLAGGEGLGDMDRVRLVRAYAQQSPHLADPQRDATLAAALADSSRAVRLAAAVAIHRLSSADPDALVRLLGEAVESDDWTLRRSTREELRALLLAIEVGDPQNSPLFEPLLRLLTRLLDHSLERPEVAEALADVARRHREAVVPLAGSEMLAYREDEDPQLCAAVLRFVGWAGLHEHADWLVSRLVADGDAAPAVRAAAREGLQGLGEAATEALLAELSFGHRRSRDAVLPLVRELPGAADALRSAYRRELGTLRFKLVQLGALKHGGIADAVVQRLRERVEEGFHTTLHLLASLHRDNRILTAARHLRRPHSKRRHAMLVEALEALLPRGEREQLVPLLEGDTDGSLARRAARSLGRAMPSATEVERTLREDPDRLTRELVRATTAAVDARSEMPETARVQSPIERALLLRGVAPFESLTTRQLVHLAERMAEEAYESGATIVAEGAPVSSLYLVVEGGVTVRRAGATVGELGPSEHFGEVAIFDADHPSAALVAKGSGARLLSLARENLLEAMEEIPEIAIRVCESFSRRLLDPVDSAGV